MVSASHALSSLEYSYGSRTDKGQSNFIVGQITPDLIKDIKYGTFIFFGLLTVGGVLFVWFVVPETKRLSLEEMDTIFGTQGVAEAVS